MSQIDNIIYNTLASGRDLYLPDVGSLIVRHSGAKRLSARRLLPPQTTIVLSKEERGVSIVALITSAANVTPERAEAIYRNYLQQTMRDGHLAIEGVGEICDAKFLIDTQFNNLINPMGNNEIRIRPLTNYLLISFAALSLLFALGVAGYIIYSEQVFADKMDKASVGRANIAKAEQPVAEPVEPTEQPTQTEQSEQTATAEEPALPAQPIADGQTAETVQTIDTDVITHTQSGRSYAVWGVYIERVNAEAAQRSVNRRFTDLNARIYRYSDRYMVALFDCDTRSECVSRVERLRESSRSFAEVWVYTKRK